MMWLQATYEFRTYSHNLTVCPEQGNSYHRQKYIISFYSLFSLIRQGKLAIEIPTYYAVHSQCWTIDFTHLWESLYTCDSILYILLPKLFKFLPYIHAHTNRYTTKFRRPIFYDVFTVIWWMIFDTITTHCHFMF